MCRTTADLKLRTQMNRLSLNNLIRHSSKPASVADVFLPHLTLTYASSFGTNSIPDSHKDSVREYLSEFAHVSPLITMKISDAAYRWIIKEKENEVPYISATYKLLLRNCLLCAVLLFGINLFIPVWNCYYFIAILIGDRMLECLQKLLRGLKNQKLFAASGLFHTIVLVGLNFYKVCVLKEGVIALLQSSVISIYATIALVLLLEKRLRKVDFKPNYKQHQREMLRYSVPLVPSKKSWHSSADMIP